MDPHDFFRGFFGMNRPPNRNPRSEENDEFDEENQPPRHRGSFHVFTNPLEMESFFNQQFDEILKQFGFGQFPGGAFPGHGHPGHPGLQPYSDQEVDESGARDFMLKKDDHPGYIRTDQRQDTEIDEVPPEDLGKLYPQQEPSRRPVNPHFNPRFHEGQDFSKSFSFGQSFSSQTIQMPDGSKEIRKTVRDNEGRETVTITKQNGQECLTVTTIKHPDGREERTESNECPQMNNFNSSLRQFHGDSIIDKWLKS